MNEQGSARIKPLRIDRQTNIDDCEALVADLRARCSDVPLILANEWKLDSRPGGVAAGAQTLITWARAQDDALLVTHSQPREREATLDNLCRRFHGIVAAMMAARIVEIDTTTDISRTVYDRIRANVVGMNDLNFEGWTRNHALPLFCIDHSSLRFLRPFYHQSEDHALRDPGDFVDLLEGLMIRAAPAHHAGLRPLAKDLGIVLHELFSNTHVHARTDAAHKEYPRSVRGVSLAERTVISGRIDDLGPGRADLERYLHAVERTSPGRSTFKVFEISVFDSGPGMAARRKGRAVREDMSVEEEASIVRDCFLRRSSSQVRPGFGMGLPRVLNVLRERGGYIGVRAGRIALSRHFDPGSAARTNADDGADMLDADTGGILPTCKQRMEGTAVTILVPLGPPPR